jgi:hypothetical protein
MPIHVTTCFSPDMQQAVRVRVDVVVDASGNVAFPEHGADAVAAVLTSAADVARDLGRSLDAVHAPDGRMAELTD